MHSCRSRISSVVLMGKAQLCESSCNSQLAIDIGAKALFPNKIWEAHDSQLPHANIIPTDSSHGVLGAFRLGTSRSCWYRVKTVRGGSFQFPDLWAYISYWFAELSKVQLKVAETLQVIQFFCFRCPVTALRRCSCLNSSQVLGSTLSTLHQSDPKSPHGPLGVAPLRAPYDEQDSNDSKMSIRALLCNAWHLSAGCCGSASSVGQ